MYDLSSQSKSRSHFKVCWRFLTALVKKKILQSVLLSFFSVFIFSMPSKVICLAARAKMSKSRAQNIFMPANINSIVILCWTSRCRPWPPGQGWYLLFYFSLWYFAAAASPTSAEEDLWSEFIQSGQSEVCIPFHFIHFSIYTLSLLK